LKRLTLMFFATFNVTSDSAPDDRANYQRWLSTSFHPLLNEILFEGDTSWIAQRIVRTNYLKETTVSLCLLVSGYDTVHRGFMLPKSSETKNNCHSNSLIRFQEN
jgi:hypothetical protein